MEKCEFTAVIKHIYLTGLTTKEINAELDSLHDISVPVLAIVYNWMNELKHSRTSTENKYRPGSPVNKSRK